MLTERVLLVCIGALGDLAWRKFIGAARHLENVEPNIELLLVDLPWDEAFALPLEKELYWRIGRRLIELLAEQISEGKVPNLSLTVDLSGSMLPWDADHFFEEAFVTGPPKVKHEIKEKLKRDIDDWLRYLLGTSVLTRLPRYVTGIAAVGNRIQRLKESGWKVVVHVATPPQAYPEIINQWRFVSDRIVLEKPACGLDSKSLRYAGGKALLQQASTVPASCQLVTNDHYNAKSLVRLLKRFADFGIFRDILSPPRVKRVVLQLLEPSPLPLGRCSFYVGAGGVFGDMGPHIFQTIRALFGAAVGFPRIDFNGHFRWGRYADAAVPAQVATEAKPYVYDPHYYRGFDAVTETFVAFQAQVRVDGHAIPFFCRAGKGLQNEAKILRVDAAYNEDSPELSFLFNFGDNTFTIVNEETGFVFGTGQLTIKDPFESGVPSMSWEYKGVYETLVSSRWEPDALDSRYFPSLTDGIEMSDLIYAQLFKERHNPSRVLNSYSPKKPSTQTEILGYLDNVARWD